MMYLIKQSGKLIAYTAKPIWTISQKNGVNISTVRKNANGVVVNEVMYNLFGTVTNGHEIVTAEEAEDTIELAQELKIFDISGKCSGAIYQGVDIGELHYNFTATTQTNLETIARRISEGTTSFLYRADNEDTQRVYTAEEMSAIIDAKDKYIAVNTNYYEQLKIWINRETDVDTLNTIDYGSTLPDDLMLELATKLASIGIDITKYSAMLGSAE